MKIENEMKSMIEIKNETKKILTNEYNAKRLPIPVQAKIKTGIFKTKQTIDNKLSNN